MINNKVFARHPLKAKYYECLEKWNKEFNLAMIMKIRPRHLRDYYTQATFEMFVNYRFNLVNEWITENFELTWVFNNNLHKIINRLDLSKYLSTVQKNYLDELESAVFTITRPLKKLDNDLELAKKEKCYFIYDNVVWTDKRSIKFKDLKNYQRLYITNLRIIVKDKEDIVQIKISEISKLTLEGDWLIIKDSHNKVHHFHFDMIDTLYYSIKRIKDKK